MMELKMLTQKKQLFKLKILPNFQYLLKKSKYLPTSICIEVTNKCNLNCIFCLRNRMLRRIGDMSFSVFKKIIDQIPSLKSVSLYFMGESFLNLDIFKMINYAEDHNIRTTIATNSSFLYPNIHEILRCKLSKLILSLDGMTKDTLSKYRSNINFENTIKGIEMICKEKISYKKSIPFIKIRFLVFKHNEHELSKVINFAKKNNVDELAFVRPILDWGHHSLPEPNKEWLSTNEKYRRYTKEGKLKNPLNYCTWIWTPIITWDGNVIPCCYDYDANILLGNIFEKPFYEIYWSKKYQKIRKRMAMKDLDLCKFCKQIENPEIENFYLSRMRTTSSARRRFQ